MRLIRSAVVMAITVLSMSVAQAGSKASASVSGLTFTLIDLDPNDGVTAAFNFTNAAGSTAFRLSATDTSLGEVDRVSSTQAGTFSFSRDQWLSLTNTSTHVTLSDEQLSVSGAANGPDTAFSGDVWTGYTDFLSYLTTGNLALTANSLLLIDTNYDLVAEASNAKACSGAHYYYYYSCAPSESASATVSVWLRYDYSDDNVSASYSQMESRSLQSYASGAYTTYSFRYDPYDHVSYPVFVTGPASDDQFQHESGTMRSVFSNSSDSTKSAAFYLSASVAGSAMTAAVPEPSTYALVLSGLGGIGLLALRRRRQA